MNLLAWNCRGLGLPRTVQELVLLVRSYRPKIVFVCKTRQGEKKIKDLRYRLGLKNCITQIRHPQWPLLAGNVRVWGTQKLRKTPHVDCPAQDCPGCKCPLAHDWGFQRNQMAA